MAFNPVMEARRKPSVRTVSEDRASSFFSDSQTSWVVFNPAELRPFDILSLSTEHPFTSTEDDGFLLEAREDAVSAVGPRRHFSGSQIALSQVSHEGLINDLALSRRINEWQKTTDTSVSDNVASWDLDEDLVGQVLETPVLRRVPAYYGDEYFKNMSRIEYIRFQRSSAVLRQSLCRNGVDASDPELVPRLLRLLKWQDLLRSPGSLVDDYIVNTLSRVNLRQRVHAETEFSDTASSSPVMCGGSSGTWNDI
ncbi:hypothetical protein METBIDRAFT_169890 [Metschnikowia bicuspidata var. bicuspidata NRRL YB-4993]|uniref:Uncharacterized protein n=1 Tax=Metschnikowia bicuspidata var. bicuspidata NRRL YB-4993 TaxID=869754 RepID=A0A1A0HAC0_9ASCO|nr:hypothetical protein METBIDRAFT_169890 [Metschnikowia bicuspidata var. bicuspidata NRRL YB-4993]OBA20950.1 hypothetical protein METBIDRAFT_169890 [Metschnikowia bicuspidata var. bicuspidata NRRL YB-4993]